jgi:hypothetical protein
VAALIVIAGCSGSTDDTGRRPTAPASGVVTYLGKPIEGATITFISKANPVPAYGTTDEEGKFQLTTYEQGDGAVIGEHFVTINKTTGFTPPAGPPSTGNDDPEDYDNYVPPAMGATPPPVVKHLIPEHYSEAETSGLSASVSAKEANSFTFNLAN